MIAIMRINSRMVAMVILLAALVTRALAQFDLRFAVPVGQLIVLATVAVIAGLLAAITPARRAAKLDPLRALQYE